MMGYCLDREIVIKVGDHEENEVAADIDRTVYYGDADAAKRIVRTDYNDFLKRDRKTQNLENFDEQYSDLVDYIVKITHGIWEEKSIGLIYDTYHNDVTMHLGSCSAYGIQSVISGTLQTLYSFPDRRLIAQNVIWSEHGNGYLSSHRIQSIATNLNDSSFGPATNKKIKFRTTVDCLVENNRIYEEWLVRDNLTICEQLGYDPHEIAKCMAKNSEVKGLTKMKRFGLDENMNGQIIPEIHLAKEDSIGEYVLEMLSKIYNYRLFNLVKEFYTEQAVIHYICNQDLVGYSQIQGMLISLFASFPNAKYSVDRVTCNENKAQNETFVAVRWRLTGLHEGLGYFGKPSFKPVEILGINHFTFSGKQVVEEWMTFDGLDVLKQIYAEDESCESDEVK